MTAPLTWLAALGGGALALLAAIGRVAVFGGGALGDVGRTRF